MNDEFKTKDEFNIELVFLLYWIIVIVAKVIRYTILKETLVNMSLGNGWIQSLYEGGNHFIIDFARDSVASENSKALFQIFKYIGLSTYRDYEIAITLIWNILFISVLFTVNRKLSLTQIVFLLMSIAVLNIWDFCLAKEPLQMIYFLAIYYILISKRIKLSFKYPLALLVILFSSITYRKYYLLIIVFSIIAFFLIGKFLKNKETIGWYDVSVVLVAYAMMYMIMIIASKYINKTSYEVFMYFNKRVTVATTDLSSLFHSEYLPIMAIDYILLVIRMLFPIELMRFGPQYWIYALYQIIMSMFIIKAFLNIKKNSTLTMYALYIYTGFLFASATFEPDFGSWIRHEAVTLPIILILIGTCTDTEKSIRIKKKKAALKYKEEIEYEERKHSVMNAREKKI